LPPALRSRRSRHGAGRDADGPRSGADGTGPVPRFHGGRRRATGRLHRGGARRRVTPSLSHFLLSRAVRDGKEFAETAILAARQDGSRRFFFAINVLRRYTGRGIRA